jgi:hypothetical protein
MILTKNSTSIVVATNNTSCVLLCPFLLLRVLCEITSEGRNPRSFPKGPLGGGPDFHSPVVEYLDRAYPFSWHF